jgi:Protein of unknown function (DUF3168)
MASSAWELQKAIYAALAADVPLGALLGGARVYDDVPRGIEPPYITFGQSTVRDWSTGTDPGHEHLFTLHVWTRVNGERLAHQIMSAVRDRLHDGALTLTGFRLVNMRHEFSDSTREPDGETIHGVVRFRAITEPV